MLIQQMTSAPYHDMTHPRITQFYYVLYSINIWVVLLSMSGIVKEILVGLQCWPRVAYENVLPARYPWQGCLGETQKPCAYCHKVNTQKVTFLQTQLREMLLSDPRG